MSNTKALLEDLRVRVRSPYSVIRSDVVAEMFNLPVRQQIPTPGAARNWGRQEWSEWGRKYGITEYTKTTHTHTLAHPQLTTLRIPISTSPGDFRAGMQLAGDVRQYFTSELDKLALMVSFALDDLAAQLDDVPYGDAIHVIVHWVLQSRHAPRMVERIRAAERTMSSTPTDETKQLTKDVVSRLNKIEARSNASWRSTIRRILAAEDADVERVLSNLKLGAALPVEEATSLLIGTDDIIEALDVVEEEERAAKQRSRDADEREKAERALTAATGETGYKNAITNFRGDVVEQCRVITKIAGEVKSLIEAKMVALERMSREFPFPAYPADQLKTLTDRAKVAEASVTAANERLVEVMMQLDERTAQVDAMAPELEKLRRDHDAAVALFNGVADGTNWKVKFEDLVDRLTPLLASDSFLTLPGNVVSARGILKTAREAIPALAEVKTAAS